MKKRATGLTSVPTSSVPGSEDVEVNSLESEDIEAGNHGGFNQVDPSEFSILMNIINKESANYNFHNIKVSNKMKEELIKLNKALNGLGYKNLIKMAQAADFGSPVNTAGVTPGAYYLWQEQGLVIEVLNKFEAGSGFYVSNDTEMSFKIKYARRGIDTFFDGNTKNFIDKNKIYEDNLDNDEKAKLVPINDINKYNSYENVFNAYVLENFNQDTYQDAYNSTENVHEDAKDSPGESNSGYDETPPSTAGTSTPSAPTPGVKTTNRHRNTTKNWEDYLKKDEGDSTRPRYQIWNLWKTFSKSNNNYSDEYYSYQKWWINTFKNKGLQGHTSDVILELKKLINETTKQSGATGAAATTAQTPAQSAGNQVSTLNGTVGGVNIQIDGKTIRAAMIGTFGRDQLLVDIDSITRGSPEIYIKSGKNFTKMGPSQIGRIREYLSRRDIRSFKRELQGSGLSPDQVEAFAKYMNLNRRDHLLGGLAGKRRGDKMEEQRKIMRGDKMEEQREKMSRTAARQSRLDSLKKKGII